MKQDIAAYSKWHGRLEGWIERLTLLLVFLLPFQHRFTRIFRAISQLWIPDNLELPSFFSKKIDFYFIDGIILFIVLLCITQMKSIWKDRASQWLLVFVGCALLSVSVSLTSGYLLQYYRLGQFLLFVLLFCGISLFLNQSNKTAFIQQVLWVFFFSGIIQCAICIAQYFLQHPLGIKILGEMNICQFSFPMQGGYRWIIDHWVGFVADRMCVYRVSGTFTHPNVLGGFLLTTILVNYHLIVVQEKKMLRGWLCLALSVQIFALSVTFSRAAIIGTVLSSVMWLLLGRHFSLMRRLAVMATLIGSILLCLFLFFDQFFERGGIVNYSQFVAGADQERITYQGIAWKMFKDHLLLGGGFNNFQILSAQYAPEGQAAVFFAKVHNIYLLVLAETGLLGATAFLIFLGSVFYRGISNVFVGKQIQEQTLMFSSIFIGFLFIGCCDYYLMHTHQGMLLFFLILAILYSNNLKNRESYKELC